MLGIIFIGIGEYLSLFEDFYQGAETFFFPGVKKRYFLVSDFSVQTSGKVLVHENVVYVKAESCAWPWPTLNRFEYVLRLSNQNLLDEVRNVFFFNANCRFVSTIEDQEILDAPLLATTHPGFFSKPRTQFTYEHREVSSAFIPLHEGSTYVAGGLQGGRRPELLDAYKECFQMLRSDLSKNIIAIWHDESYWNRFVANIQSSDPSRILILGPEYLYPVAYDIPANPKIIILNKKFVPSSYATNLQEGRMCPPGTI